MSSQTDEIKEVETIMIKQVAILELTSRITEIKRSIRRIQQ